MHNIYMIKHLLIIYALSIYRTYKYLVYRTYRPTYTYIYTHQILHITFMYVYVYMLHKKKQYMYHMYIRNLYTSHVLYIQKKMYNNLI